MYRIAGLRFAALLTFIASALAAESTSQGSSPEARGVWLHLSDFSADPGKGRSEVHQIVERLANANFNLVMPWVLSEYAAALTDTNYVAAAPTAAWDALGELSREAARRGMRIHLWYSFTYYKSPKSPDFDPTRGGDPSWAARSLADFQHHTNPMTDVCPSHPAARKWEVALIESLLRRYTNISGIHIEEPGYGYPQNCLCDLCRSVFKDMHGEDLEKKIAASSAEDFRCIGMTEFIRELRQRLSQMNPRPILSVNGGSSWRSDRSLGRDWKRWAELGWLDFYASQNYSGEIAPFSAMTQMVLKDLSPHCPVFIGIGIKWSGGATALPVVLKQIADARSRHAGGILFFSAKSLTDEYLDALREGPFGSRADFPLTSVRDKKL